MTMLPNLLPQSRARSTDPLAEMNCCQGWRPTLHDGNEIDASSCRASRHQEHQPVDLFALHALNLLGDEAMMLGCSIAAKAILGKADQALALKLDGRDLRGVALSRRRLRAPRKLALPVVERRRTNPLPVSQYLRRRRKAIVIRASSRTERVGCIA